MTTIELNKKEFIKALVVGGSFSGKSKLMPILDCVKIKVSNGNITIVSSDNENAISKKSDIISSDGNLSFCVNYKDISSYVKLINGEKVFLDVEDSSIKIRHNNGSIDLPIYDSNDFPLLSAEKESVEITLDSYLLNNWIIDSKEFIGDDDLRPVMNSIYLYSKNGELGCCATDSNILFTDNVNESNIDFSFMINKNSFKSICDVCSSSEKIIIKIGEKSAMFIGENISVLATLQNGNYPNFKNILTQTSPIEVKISKKEFLDSINRVKLGADNSSCLIKIVVSGMNMEVSAQDIDFNRKAVENIMVNANGEITIGFNANRLITSLNSINSENVIMKFTDKSRHCLINEDDEKSNKTVLIMPMILN